MTSVRNRLSEPSTLCLMRSGRLSCACCPAASRPTPNLVAITTCRRTVNLGGIEECDAAFHGRADERDHRRLVRWDAVALAHPHAAEPEGRDFEMALSKFAFLH